MAARSPRLDTAVGSPLPVYPLRSSSRSSDVASTRSTGPTLTAPHANPPPAYVASSEADDLISTELARTVHVAPAALTLLNEFLDHVLYSIICTSHSLSLGQLKAAVPIVLKPRLGKSALKVAEEELKDYIEDDEAEELYSNKNNLQAKLVFDADLVWKLARLRCMVYARMGDLEEDDEDEWLEREGLLDETAALSVTARLSMAVAPGAAIFLTSVIEYLGEQALYFAAQYAQKRHDAACRVENTGAPLQSQLITEDADILLDGKDMNHVGRDSPLSRLWRSWRRNTRSAADGPSRPMSPEDALPPSIPFMRSQTPATNHTYQPAPPIHEHRRFSATSTHTPSGVPPPITENDIEEVREQYFVVNGENRENETRRPLSMPVLTRSSLEDASTPSQQVPDFPERSPLRPRIDRERSNSLPARRTPTPINDEARLVLQDRANSRDGPTPTPETVNSTKKQHLASSPEHTNTTVPMLAGNLPVVGVHHIQQRPVLSPLDVDNSTSHPESQAKRPNQPLTSASITGPRDFNNMYMPEGESPPERPDAEQSRMIPVLQASTQKPNSYEQLAAQQLEEHKQYSQQSHQMNTPSIYTNHQHSPRFRTDSPPAAPVAQQTPSKTKEKEKRRSISTPEANSRKVMSSSVTDPESEPLANPSAPTAEPQRAVSRQAVSPEPGRTMSPYAPSSYAPTPEPGLIYDDNGNYIYGASNEEPSQSWQRQTESPVSQLSGKYPAKRYHPTNEPVPELPRTITITNQQGMTDATFAPHADGHSKSSSSSSRLLGFTRDTSGKPHSIYQQSAIGGMSDEVRRAHASTPDPKAETQEVDQHSSSPKRHHLRIRGDSEINATTLTSNSYHSKRSLEHLIQSDETLHYTLTPPNASLEEETMSQSTKRTQTQDLADFFKNTAPPGQENTALPSTRSRKASMNATRAPQVLPVVRGPVPSSNGVTTENSAKPAHKNPVGQPRDAKVDRMSGVRDLADYARSTGPSNADQLPKAVITGPTMVRGTDRAVEMAAPNSPVDKSFKSPRPQSRLKFQARDPRPSRHAESTDLVDFIREGPPRSQNERISDRGAPSLRTTTASDDTNKRTSSNTKGSIDTNGVSSVTDSQSPLINNDNKSTTPIKATFGQQTSQAEPNGNVQLKSRKAVKDPYAIDYDDDDLKPARPLKKRNEESLIDFLRNTEPTSDSLAQPIISSTANRPTTNGPASNGQTRALKQIETQNQIRARASSPHLTQAGSKLDSYRPTQATHASHVDRNRNKTKTRSGSVPKLNGDGNTQTMKAFGSGGGGGGETADLANYLKSTRPTSVQAGWTEPLVNKPVNGVNGESGTGGLRKFFSIKRK